MTNTINNNTEMLNRVRIFINMLCVDSENSMIIGTHYITGTIVEVLDDEGDIYDYERRFTIDGEEADEYDVLRLCEE